MVSRGRWGRGARGAAVAVCALAAAAFTASAQAAQAPSDGGPSCWFQTNGRDAPLNKGDWYTSRLTTSTQRSHLFQIVVPAGADFPVVVRVHDAEVRVASAEQHDEVENGADPTRFTLRSGGSILDRQTFPPGSPAGSVFRATITAADGPGTYHVVSETGAFPISGERTGRLNDDENSFRIEVLPDGGTTPEASDDVRIAFTRATIACTPLPTGPASRLALAYTVPAGTTVTALRNFDLDVAPEQTTGAPTYVPPSGAAVFGTMSVDSAWNGGGTRNAGEDLVPIAAGQHGRWTIQVPGTYWKNQVAFEAWAGDNQLPLSVVPLNSPAEWADPDPVTVREPVGDDPVPVLRSVPLEFEEEDSGQTLSFSLPDGGQCKATTTGHPFAGVSFAPSSVVSGSGTEAMLRLPIGAQDAGVHCVRVRVTDGASAQDLELTVTVTEENSAPRANAGPDRSAHQPGDSVTLDGSGTDPDGTVPTLSWSQLSGPATLSFPPGDPLTVAPPVVGTYKFLLTADDGQYARADEVVLTVRDGEPVVSPPRFQKVPARRAVAVRLGSFSDPGSTAWDVTVKWGKNGPVQTLADRTRDGSLGTARHRFRSGGLYALTVSVTDEDGRLGAATFNVKVRPPCRVPDVRGKTLTRARNVLKRRSCTLGSVTRAFSGRVRAGRIISQKPRAGAVRATGAKVRVKVSRGPRG